MAICKVNVQTIKKIVLVGLRCFVLQTLNNMELVWYSEDRDKKFRALLFSGLGSV